MGNTGVPFIQVWRVPLCLFNREMKVYRKQYTYKVYSLLEAHKASRCMEKNTLGSSKYNYFNIIEFLILGGCLIKRFIFSLWQSLCNLRRKQRCVAAWLHHLSNCVIFIQKGHASVNDILLGSEVLDLRS